MSCKQNKHKGLDTFQLHGSHFCINHIKMHLCVALICAVDFQTPKAFSFYIWESQITIQLIASRKKDEGIVEHSGA